jgi:hypothetical protein
MNIEEGIREDGTVEDCEFETFYAPLEYITEGNGYLRVVGDDGPGFIEIRVPFELLNKMGWTKP